MKNRKEALIMLLDEAKIAVENNDELTFKKVSDQLVYIDEYAKLCDNLHELYNSRGDGLITKLETQMVVVDELATMGFPNAEQLSDTLNDSINYFKELTKD